MAAWSRPMIAKSVINLLRDSRETRKVRTQQTQSKSDASRLRSQ